MEYQIILYPLNQPHEVLDNGIKIKVEASDLVDAVSIAQDEYVQLNKPAYFSVFSADDKMDCCAELINEFNFQHNLRILVRD